jgi:hypothetical protein
MPLIDLRQHFGLWERCRNTSFWRELGRSSSNRLLVNPMDGAMISAHDHPYVDGPALQVVVRDASEIDEQDVVRAYEQNYPWVKNVLSDFFTGLAILKTKLVKETPQSFFVKYYADQTRQYKETGEGHSDVTGKDEMLMATKKILASLGDRAVVLRKLILRDEWDEFLEGYGILEC